MSDTSDSYPRSGSFKDNDKYMRTRSGTYVRRDSADSLNRRESNTMPEFRYIHFQFIHNINILRVVEEKQFLLYSSLELSKNG